MRQERSQSGVGQFAREQPLLTAVLCVSFGVVLGCLLRMTPEDREYIGDQADKLKDQAGKLKETVGGMASDGIRLARQYADSAMDAAADAVSPVKTTWGHADEPNQEGKTNREADIAKQ